MLALDPLSAQPLDSTGYGRPSLPTITAVYTPFCGRVRPRWGTGFKWGTGVRWGEGQRENPGRPCAPMDHYLADCDPAFAPLSIVTVTGGTGGSGGGGDLLGFGAVSSAPLSAVSGRIVATPITTTVLLPDTVETSIFTPESAEAPVFALEPVCG